MGVLKVHKLKGLKLLAIGSLTLIVLTIAHIRLGLFNRYNFVTAYADQWAGNQRIIIYGEPFEGDSLRAALAPRLGFRWERRADCVVTSSFVNGVEQYNAIMGEAISNRLGGDWDQALDKAIQEIGK